MSDYPLTRPSLLLRMRDVQNQQAWDQFVEIYTPLIFGYCYKQQLGDADAADVAQEVLASVSKAIRDFDYSTARGRFRGWLLTVVRSKVNDHFRRLNRYHELCNEAFENQVDDGDSDEQRSLWEREYRRHLYEWVASKVQVEFADSTWKAFLDTAVQGRSATEVAGELGMSVGAVYIAKSRVTARLKQLMAEVEENGGDLLPQGDQ